MYVLLIVEMKTTTGTTWKGLNQNELSGFFSLFLWGVGFEPRVLCLPDRHSTAWVMSPALFAFVIFQIGSYIFAWTVILLFILPEKLGWQTSTQIFFLCVYIVWVISPPCPPPPPFPPSPPQFQAGPVLPLWLTLLKRRPKHNEKDKAFLLVEIRTAIQRDS
jgi:hypothetical protein